MFVLTLLITTLTLAICHWYYKRRRLPPGPPAVPLLGSLPFLDTRRGLTDWSSDPRVTRHRLATVTLGPRNLFVINDLMLAKELFDKEEFNGRYVSEWVRLIKFVNGKIRGIGATEGPNWSKQRRFGLKTLRDLGFGRRTIEEIVDREIDEITNKFSNLNGQDYLMGSDLNIPVINVLWQLVAGYSFDKNHSQGRHVINNIQRLIRSWIHLITFPVSILKIFRKTFFYENLKLARNQISYILDEIDQHRATLDRENPRDFIDVYLTSMEDDEGLNTDDLAFNLFDFLLAGTETSSTTLKWVVLYLTLHQEVQDRCRKEIREVIGDNKCRVEDIKMLPYTKATVSEVHRLAAVFPLSVSHTTTTSVKVEGFSFPPGSWFALHSQFIMKDPAYFHLPETFNPDRFIGEDGRYKKHPALVPFGVGKRQCMGEALARNELMLFTVGLIQRLTFLPPDSGALPDPQDYHVGGTRIPSDFPVKIKMN